MESPPRCWKEEQVLDFLISSYGAWLLIQVVGWGVVCNFLPICLSPDVVIYLRAVFLTSFLLGFLLLFWSWWRWAHFT